MSNRPLANFIFAGPNKSGSTWSYQALQEHPDVFMSNKEPVNYFDLNYHRGEDWYRSQFEGYNGESAIGDESPGYIKHPYAPKRIAKDIPEAKIIFCLRNPVRRAFSQWWHEEQYWTDTLSWGGGFEYIMDHHPPNDVFITPGYYHYHLSRWKDYLSDDQIKVVLYDDFKSDNESYIQEIYSFIGVDENFTPSIAGESINKHNTTIEPKRLKRVRGDLQSKFPQYVKQPIAKKCPEPIKRFFLKPIYYGGLVPFYSRVNYLYDILLKPFTPKNYYEEGMDPNTQKELEKVYRKDAIELEREIGRDLSHWFEYIEL